MQLVSYNDWLGAPNAPVVALADDGNQLPDPDPAQQALVHVPSADSLVASARTFTEQQGGDRVAALTPTSQSSRASSVATLLRRSWQQVQRTVTSLL